MEGRLRAPRALSCLTRSSTWAGAVAGVEPLELPGGRVGGEGAVLPVGVLAELGWLAGRAGDTAGDDPRVGGPAGETVPAGAGAQDPGQVRHPASGSADTVGGQRLAPVALA